MAKTEHLKGTDPNLARRAARDTQTNPTPTWGAQQAEKDAKRGR